MRGRFRRQFSGLLCRNAPVWFGSFLPAVGSFYAGAAGQTVRLFLATPRPRIPGWTFLHALIPKTCFRCCRKQVWDSFHTATCYLPTTCTPVHTTALCTCTTSRSTCCVLLVAHALRIRLRAALCTDMPPPLLTSSFCSSPPPPALSIPTAAAVPATASDITAACHRRAPCRHHRRLTASNTF